jgi:flagellar biosynthesis protein FlhB
MTSNVPKANVVVVNPTHLAIALEYDDGDMAAPRVTARGANTTAELIRDLARKHHIPVMRNIPLAHSLYQVELGKEIPEDLYEAVAEVLNWVQQLTNKDKAGDN